LVSYNFGNCVTTIYKNYHSLWTHLRKCFILLRGSFVFVSVESNVSCNFDDIDCCGYRDLSDTGINWSQIYNQSKIISDSFYRS